MKKNRYENVRGTKRKIHTMPDILRLAIKSGFKYGVDYTGKIWSLRKMLKLFFGYDHYPSEISHLTHYIQNDYSFDNYEIISRDSQGWFCFLMCIDKNPDNMKVLFE